MQQFKKKPLILVDGSSYLFRAYYALPPLTNAAGLPTGAVYGVLNMLRSLVKEYTPSHIAVVFDTKGKTTRHEWFPEYKANRAVMPEELAQQIPYLHRAIEALGLPLVMQSGIEADDLIGTFTQRAVEAGMPVLISTGDKDMAQLVNDQVHLINTMSNQRLDTEGVKQKFGVNPNQIIDYLALMGDTSDNIPGVTKVGPKTAVKWLDRFGSLDALIAEADQVSGKVGENLRSAIETQSLALARRLVTIDCAVDHPGRPGEFVLGESDSEQLRALFSELEFSRWLAELDDGSVSDEGVPEKLSGEYEAVLTLDDWQHWRNQLAQSTVFAFDTETTGLDPMQADLVGFSVAVEPGRAAYIPLGHDYEGAPQQCEREQVLDDLRVLLSDERKTLVGHNIKYDLHVLQCAGVVVKTQLWDTLLASYALNPSVRGHGLDALALRLLNHTMISFESVAGKGAKQLTFNQVVLEQATPYAAEDADMTLRLYNAFKKQCDEEPTKQVLYDIDLPVMRILADMEHVGVALDQGMLAQQSEVLGEKLATLQTEIFELAGQEFNISSPKQLQQLLFEKLQLPVIKKTPKGQPSTSEEVLQQLALDYPLPKLILEYRSAQKLKSTYTDKLPLQVNPKTQRVHTQYNQAVTTTGRLSSNNPNLQNIPVRHADGRKIRRAFVTSAQRQIVAADYSQVELRIMAHLSQDTGLLSAFAEGVDVHAATAAEVFSVPVESVSSEQRRRAKAINFGLMYGMSAFGLAKQLGIGRQDAQQYIDIYFDRYPNVLAYLDTARAMAQEKGYVETLTGRRLYTPDINSSNGLRRKAAERAAINAPLQGSAADIIKLAMINCARWLPMVSGQVSLLMQVHDELVFSVDRAVIDETLGKIKTSMESAIELSVPLIVECGVGDDWDAAH
jgi:DNA polymerase I